jgi:hypothetical protein
MKFQRISRKKGCVPQWRQSLVKAAEMPIAARHSHLFLVSTGPL